MVEEHVDQLPEHVVERLDQLLAHERVVAGRLELPLGRRRREGDRQAAALARQRERRGGLAVGSSTPKPIDDVVGLGDSVDLRRQRPALGGRGRSPAAPACRRSPGGRTRPRRGARPSAPPGRAPTATRRPPRAKRSAIRDSSARAARPRRRRTRGWRSCARASSSSIRPASPAAVASRHRSPTRPRLRPAPGPLRDRREPLAPGLDALARAGADQHRARPRG